MRLSFPIRLHAVVVKIQVNFSNFIYSKFTLTLPYEYKFVWVVGGWNWLRIVCSGGLWY